MWPRVFGDVRDKNMQNNDEQNIDGNGPGGVNFSFNEDGELEPEPNEDDIKKLLDLAKSGKFESGIYNYCDRWCEKCPDTARCFLCAEERINKKKIAAYKGDEHDIWADVEYSFKTTGKIIDYISKQEDFQEKMAEVADDLSDDDKDEDEIERKFSDIECLQLAKEYMKKADEFIKKYEQSREQYKNELNLKVPDEDIKDDIDIMVWYHTFLPTKVWRCLYEREDVKRKQDDELREMVKEGYNKFIALVGKCLDKSKTALGNLILKREVWAEELAELVNHLNLLELSFKKEHGLPYEKNLIIDRVNDEQEKALAAMEADNENALSIALNYLARNPHDKLASSMVADAFVHCGRFKKALPFLKLSAAVNSGDPHTLLIYGVMLAKTGRFNKGLAYVQKAAELQPQDNEILRNVGWITAMLGRFKDDREKVEEGREILKQVAAAEPDNTAAMVDLAQSYLMERDFASSLKWITKAKKADSDDELVDMIYNDVAEGRKMYEENGEFKKFVDKEKFIKAYSGPPVKNDDEMDDNIARQFEFEELIGQLNGGGLNPKEMERVFRKLEKTGMVGQITAIKSPDSPDAQVATEYIQYHQKIENVEKKIGSDETEKCITTLSEAADVDEQKRLILILAHQGTEEALAGLEKAAAGSEGEMAVWYKMAINECRAFLEVGEEKTGIFFNEI